jgi:hypothetical protein
MFACQDDLPAVPKGGRIRGTVTYRGVEAREFGGVTLRVSAFPTWPPSGPPLAQQEHRLTSPDAIEPRSYELKHLSTKSTYFVVAQLIDHTQPLEQLPLDVPLGAHPSTCALGRDEGRLVVNADEPIDTIDIEIFDRAGRDDPCAPNPCPDPGRASLLLEVSSGVESVAATDQLLVVLFSAWPPPAGPPSAVQIIPGSEIAFPQTVMVENVAPADYAIYLCLDRNSDGLMGCTEEDTFNAYRSGELVSLSANTLTALNMTLEDGSGEAVAPPEDCTPARDGG